MNIRTLSVLATSLLLPLAAASQEFPAKPVTFVVPFAAGSATDQLARALGQSVAEQGKHPVLIDNKPGASGFLAAQQAAKAPADGYTVLITTNTTHAANEHLFKSMPYDPVKDFAPVTLLGKGGQIMVVNPNVPAKSVAEFIAYAKANPGKLNFGSGGPGTTPHLAGEMIKTMAGLQMTHIPYKGGAPALADLVGGQIQFMCENIPGTLPFAKSGKLRALAVTDLKRSPLLPELPTLDESGLRGYQIVGWNGLFVPTGTPPAIVTRLHSAVVGALALPDVKERLTIMGADGVGDTPQHFAAFIKAEIPKWAQVVKAAGLKIE